MQLVPIQEVYGTLEVQKMIGLAFFSRLVCLSIHESASMYSEEKSKIIIAEVEPGEMAEGEVWSVLDALGVRDGLSRFKVIVEDQAEDGESTVLYCNRQSDGVNGPGMGIKWTS